MNYLGIDVGGTFIKYGLIDHSGTLKNSKKIKTSENLESFLENIEAIIEQHQSEIKGIGISLPGKIDVEKGIIYFGGALQFLHKLPLKKIIEDKFNIPCELSNDGKAAALAEWWIGNLKGVSNGAAIVLGTGIGSGLILNDALFQGSNFQAGELSFLGDFTGEISIEKVIGLKGSAVKLVQQCAEILELEDLNDGIGVFKVIESKENEQVQKIFEEYCLMIARMIVNLQVTLDLSKIVIGGGISAQNCLIQNIQEKYIFVREQIPLLAVNFQEIKIEECKFRSDANLLGAVYNLLLALDEKRNIQL